MSNAKDQTSSARSELDRRVNSGTTGLFLVFVGVALFLDAGWGVGLIGVGVILVLEQAVRSTLAIDFSWFWLGAGLVSLFYGISMLFGVAISLVPILLMAVGVVLIASTFTGKKRSA